MNSKKTQAAVLLASLLAVLAAPRARALAEFADGVLLLSTTASATYDSRVDGGYAPGADELYALTPELQFHRDQEILKLDAYAGVTFDRYDRFTQYNSNNIISDVKLTLPPNTGPKYSGTFDIGYNQNSQVDYNVDQRVRTKTFNAALQSSIQTGLKTSVTAGGSYQNEQRDVYGALDEWQENLGFTYSDFLEQTDLSLTYAGIQTRTGMGAVELDQLNQDSNSFALTLTRPIYDTIKGSLSYGYRFLDRSAEETSTGQTNFDGATYSASINGPFLPTSIFPKLDSEIRVSYQRADTPGINDISGDEVVGDIRVSWNARENTKLSISASRSLQLTLDNYTVQQTSYLVSATEKVGYFVSLTGGGGYENLQYRGQNRTDNVWTGYFTASYSMSKYWRFDASYTVYDSTSQFATADFGRTLVTLSVTYTF